MRAKTASLVGLAGWSARLIFDTPITSSPPRVLAGQHHNADPSTSPAISEIEVTLLEATPEIRWSRANELQDLSLFFHSLEARRFKSVGLTASSKIFNDPVFSADPALEVRDGVLYVVQPERWGLYLDLVTTWIMLWESSIISLHAAVCAAGEIGIVLVGASGAGKSTLSCALAAQGADYYDDENAFFDLSDGYLYVRERSPALRPGGRSMLDTPPEGRWYQAKPNDPKYTATVPQSDRPCPRDKAVLFFLDGFGPPAITPMPGGQAILRLTKAMGHRDTSMAARLDAAADLVSRHACHRLTVGPPDMTARMLLDFVS